MPTTNAAYLDVVDFIAKGTTSRQVADFRPSPEAQRRASELIEKERAGSISSEEKLELDRYVELEHLMRLAKARAHEILAERR